MAVRPVPATTVTWSDEPNDARQPRKTKVDPTLHPRGCAYIAIIIIINRGPLGVALGAGPEQPARNRSPMTPHDPPGPVLGR